MGGWLAKFNALVSCNIFHWLVATFSWFQVHSKYIMLQGHKLGRKWPRAKDKSIFLLESVSCICKFLSLWFPFFPNHNIQHVCTTSTMCGGIE